MSELLNQLRMLREIYPHNENILKIYGLACEQSEKIAKLEKDLDKAHELFSELYQVLGAHDADTLALDICSDASKGVFRVDELLPYFVVGG
jgi:hypothetical protein